MNGKVVKSRHLAATEEAKYWDRAHELIRLYRRRQAHPCSNSWDGDTGANRTSFCVGKEQQPHRAPNSSVNGHPADLSEQIVSTAPMYHSSGDKACMPAGGEQVKAVSQTAGDGTRTTQSCSVGDCVQGNVVSGSKRKRDRIEERGSKVARTS
jgi:hypothetical protein